MAAVLDMAKDETKAAPAGMFKNKAGKKAVDYGPPGR
jgi:hypothetical protein